MRTRQAGGHRRWAVGLVGLAALWGAGLMVAALVVPAYSGGGSDSAGTAWTTSATLVQANGASVLIPVSFPVIVAVLVGPILHRHCARGSSDVAARVLIALLGLFAFVALSIGVFVLPVVVMLAVALNLTPDGPAPLTQPSVSCW